MDNSIEKRHGNEETQEENTGCPADGSLRRGATTVSAFEGRGVLNFKANIMNLPYFKFMVQDYLSGDIQACSMQTQGIYINLMARIWKKKGCLNTAQAPLAKLLRVTSEQLEEAMQELLDMDIIVRNDDGSISIKFLLKQIGDIEEDHEKHVESGRKGGLRSASKRKTGIQAPLNHTDTDTDTDTDTKTDTDTDIHTGGVVDTWKTSYEIYLKSCMDGYNALKEDTKWLAKQQKFNPNVDILLSLEKAVENFWGTEAGWKNKKSRRSKDIDWKSTLTKTIDMNKVFLPRNGFESPTVKKPLTPDAVRIRDINDCQCAIERAINSEPFDEGATSRCLKALNDKYEKNIVNQAYEWVKNNRKG